MMNFGMPSLDPSISQPLAPSLQMPAPKKKTGMFGAGGGNIGEAISAALFGALAARGNAAGTMGLQMLYQRRNAAMGQEQAAQERENSFQDFVRKQAYLAANKPPEVPDIVGRINALNGIEAGLGNTYAQNYAKSGGSPFGQLFTDPATGQRFMMGGQSNLPAIGSVVDDPRKQGGPTPPASGGFPGPY